VLAVLAIGVALRRRAALVKLAILEPDVLAFLDARLGADNVRLHLDLADEIAGHQAITP
jgi:hypothetical protein